MTHNLITQALQLNFYGLLAWGIISRISLPLLIFYRFHSCVVLVSPIHFSSVHYIQLILNALRVKFE